jgi:hypothetical protein
MSLVARAQVPGASTTPTSFKVQVVGQGRPMILIPGLMSSATPGSPPSRDTRTASVAMS